MKNKVILFKNFNQELPKEFLDTLNILCPEAVIYTTRNKIDFNRWQFNWRIDNFVIDAILITNKKYDNILDSYFELASISQDPYTGFIEVTETGKEIWNSSN